MAFYTKRSGVTNHPETTLLQEFTDLVRRGGVVSLDRDHLNVTQKAAGANMSVDINVGDDPFGSVFLKRDGNCYPAYLDAAYNIAIDTNTSGNPRIDVVVAYADLVNSPGSTNQGNDVAKFIVVKGTPAASPSAPSNSAIESAIGASDPYERLAHVTVADSASAISDANISDQRRLVFMKTPIPQYVMTYAGSLAIDYLDGDQQKVTLTGNPTLSAPTNMEIGDWLLLEFLQDATGGRSITWFSGITWLSPDTTINDTASKTTTYAIKKVGSSSYQGYLVGKEYT